MKILPAHPAPGTRRKTYVVSADRATEDVEVGNHVDGFSTIEGIEG